MLLQLHEWGDRTAPPVVAQVPGGHMVFWDAYEDTASALERFLEDPRA